MLDQFRSARAATWPRRTRWEVAAKRRRASIGSVAPGHVAEEHKQWNAVGRSLKRHLERFPFHYWRARPQFRHWRGPSDVDSVHSG